MRSAGGGLGQGVQVPAQYCLPRVALGWQQHAVGLRQGPFLSWPCTAPRSSQQVQQWFLGVGWGRWLCHTLPLPVGITPEAPIGLLHTLITMMVGGMVILQLS